MAVSGLLDKGGYTLQDVLPLVRVKPHVLRYWEQMLPLVRSGRDEGGHRIWTAAQLRMLLRVRHLVVERGVAVTAAGEALLREASGDSARVKAGLEGVRDALAATLIRLRDPSGSGLAPAGSSAGDNAPAGPGRYGIALEQLVARGVLPSPEETSRQGRDPSLSVVAPARSGREGARLVYSHLFARGAPGEIARHLAALVRHRLEQETSGEDVPLIVAVPGGLEDLYERCLPRHTFLLPLPTLSCQHTVCTAPTLALLLALASSRELDRALREWQRETVHIWAADSPHSSPRDVISPLAIAAPGGLALGVRPAPSGHRLTEAAAIHLATWRPRLERTTRCGEWVPHPRGEGRCFRLWLRDLAALGGPGVLVPGASRPGVWRGSSWLEQLRLVWGDAPFSGLPAPGSGPPEANSGREKNREEQGQ